MLDLHRSQTHAFVSVNVSLLFTLSIYISVKNTDRQIETSVCRPIYVIVLYIWKEVRIKKKKEVSSFLAGCVVISGLFPCPIAFLSFLHYYNDRHSECLQFYKQNRRFSDQWTFELVETRNLYTLQLIWFQTNATES